MSEFDRLLRTSLRYVRDRENAQLQDSQLRRTRRDIVMRVKRRRTRNAVLTSAAAIVIAIGGVAGARAVFGPEARPQPPANQQWEGLWPHTSQEDAAAAQKRVDSKDPQYMWLVDPETFLERFGNEMLGWNRVFFDDALDISEPGDTELTLRIANCEVSDPEAGCGGNALQTLVTIKRLVRQDDTGIWSVSEFLDPIEIEDTRLVSGRLPLGSFECPAGRFGSASEQDIRRVGQRLLAGANGSGDVEASAVWELLDPSLQGEFGSLEMFSYLMQATLFDESYGRWDVGEAMPAGDFVNNFVPEACGEDVLAASWRLVVTFPRFEGLSGSGVELFFVVRPDGPRLWFTS